MITVPYLQVSSHFDLPPVATYAATNLWNFRSTTGDFTDLDSLTAQYTFTGTEDESWFFALSTAMEARGHQMMQAMLSALIGISSRDYPLMIDSLETMMVFIHESSILLERMYERNRPTVFYHKIRPFLAGSKNMAAAGLPRGVFYDEGDGRGEWRQLRGGSNGQSSLIQFMDIVLGITHQSAGASSPHTSSTPLEKEKTRPFHEEVRDYMPGPHRDLLEHITTSLPSLRDFVSVPYPDAAPEHQQLQKTYQATTKALSEFRNVHLQIVTRYIVIPATGAASAGAAKPGAATNLATASASSTTGGGKGLTGTGGTALIPFLKQTRDETFMAGDLSAAAAAAKVAEKQP
jgi:indoleamine 2,3-dioxygenase